MNETVVIDTPEGIARYQMMVAITRLHIEVKTGMGSRASTLAFVKQAYGCPKGTKKGALEWMLNHYKATYGETFTLP
jgi:hypothetical protein